MLRLTNKFAILHGFFSIIYVAAIIGYSVGAFLAKRWWQGAALTALFLYESIKNITDYRARVKAERELICREIHDA